MRRHFGRATFAGGMLLFAAACGSDEKPKTSDEESSQGTADGGDDGGSASQPDAGAAEPVDYETCLKQLKPRCSYDDKETACASLTTAKIPLIDGSTWGDVEIKAGPYGGYTEWNEGMAFANPVSPSEALCAAAGLIFMEPDAVTQDVLDLRGQELSLYTVFRPACMPDGEKFPVITWGNGTCGQSGGYASLLATVASHGFVVIAASSRWTDRGNDEMLNALDFAAAANEDQSSPLYHRLDLEQVGAMGHSQGASATVKAGADPRIKSLILWNGPHASNDKPFLAVSGERDIGDPTPADMAADLQNATQPGAWLYYHKVLETGGAVTGHLTLMMQPERVTEATIAWWKFQLKGDAEAKKMFVGDSCGLCSSKDEFEFGARGL